jgi:hypothetical protein
MGAGIESCQRPKDCGQSAARADGEPLDNQQRTTDKGQTNELFFIIERSKP